MNASQPAAATLDDARAEAAYRWALAKLGLDAAQFAPASADASFRRYFRLSSASRTWIIMDAPPAQEDCRPFLKVGALLRDAGVNVPEVVAEDLDQGFLLLSDLGTQTYLDVLTPDNADALFDPAIDTLIAWQLASRPGVLPEYDAALLQRELALFPDWYLARHLGVTLEDEARMSWNSICALLVDNALAQARVFVHRDYMPRNLMVSDPPRGKLPGVLDFQDAVHGPIAYDPICLFKDAFLSWPEAQVESWLRQYHERAVKAGLPVPEWAVFQRDAEWIGLQRHLKVLGIFARINYRDGKPKYLADTPRFIRYARSIIAKYPELAVLGTLFDQCGIPP